MELKPRSSSFLNGIIFAISYFSVLPLGLKKFEADDKFYRGVIYGLPFTGALLSLVIVLGFFILNLVFPTLYSAFLISVIYLFLYGFLHLEAVADTIDGWYASYSSKNVYEIMKEPQIGAVGAIATFCIVLLKVGILAYLFYLEAYFGIFLALILSRFSLYFILDLDIHEKSSFLISMKKVKKNLYIIDVFLFPLKLIVLKIIKTLSKRIGFINGDTTGFTIEIVEILLLHVGLLFLYKL